MANIGDLFLALIADGSGLERSVVEQARKAGDAGGQTLGQRLKAGLSRERVGTILGAAFGGVAAAGLRMGTTVDDAYDLIRAGTGATGEALEGLQGDFRAVAARVPDDIAKVGQVIADLNTRTGQTGEGLQELAVNVLDFARLTKADANEAVRNATRLFGDWSIATEEQAGTLDKVYRASQATGIGVNDLMEKVVSFGSPLRLLGFGFEESIAMLAKWEKEGVNTETALTGLKFSVKTLAREGIPANRMAAEMQARIAAIGKSADPVNESIKLFGLRAGPDLAAAILEGRFATEDLLEVINNGSDTIAAATEDTQGFAQSWRKFTNMVTVNFGGLFTAFAGVSQVIGPLLYAFPALGGALGNLAARATRVVPAIANALLSLPGSGLVKRAVAVGADKLATLYLKGLMLGDRLSAGMASAINAIPGSSAVKGAIGKVRSFLGSQLGAAITVSVALVVAKVASDELTKGYSETVAKLISEGNLEGLKAARENTIRMLEAGKIGPTDFASFLGFKDGMRQVLADQDAAIAALEAKGEDTGEALALGVKRGIYATTPEVENAASKLGAAAVSAGAQFSGEAREMGNRMGEATAQGILDARAKPRDAFRKLLDMLRHPWKRHREETRLLAQLTSKELAKGLASHDPAIQAQARATKQYILDRLTELKTGSHKLTKEQAELVRRGLKSKDPQIRDAARHIRDLVKAPLVTLRDNAYDYGRGTAENYRLGLLSKKGAIAAAAGAIAAVVFASLHTNSPSEEGPFSKGGGPDGWGRTWADLYADGLRAGMPSVNRALAGLSPVGPSIVAPRLASMAGAGASAMGAAGASAGLTINGGIHLSGVGSDVSPAAANRFGRQVIDEVAAGLREQLARRQS